MEVVQLINNVRMPLLINKEEIIENHYSAMPSEIMNVGNVHQCLPREMAKHCIHMYTPPPKKYSYQKINEPKLEQAPVTTY